MDATAAARTTLDRHASALVELSHRIHAHPELKFEEERASNWTAAVLADAGLDVQSGVCDLPTAFVARTGSGPLHVAICAEYDALPVIGHACGHNVIASAAAGAGLALAPLADDLGLTISVLGTPGEEGGGGKVLMLQSGAFEGVHASMMIHPGPVDCLMPAVTAVAHVDVECTGVASHAAAAPERGVNAADALVIAQTAIGLLRQHLRPTDQVHGVVTHGGDAANVIPARASGRWMFRARTIDELAELRPRVERCFEAGALATGATVEIADVAPPYSHMEHDLELAALFAEIAGEHGRTFSPDREMTFSTDMGNVSLAVPSIHPCLAIESGGATIHQPAFADAAVNASADQCVLDGALLMALTTIAAGTGPQRDRLLARA